MTRNDLIATFLLSVVLCSFIYLGLSGVKADSEEVPQKADVIEQVEEKYATKREEHLYTKVDKSVDLPGFGDYQDLLASYAYNTCRAVIPDGGKYSCENLVQTRNAENGGWRRDATNTTNKNGTHDGGLCQLNSQYHAKFIKSDWFENPLAQLDYCLQVRVDAKNKGVMPRYAYHVRAKRNKGIVFVGSPNVEKKEKGAYYKAKNKQIVLDQLSVEVPKLRRECIDSGECK